MARIPDPSRFLQTSVSSFFWLSVTAYVSEIWVDTDSYMEKTLQNEME